MAYYLTKPFQQNQMYDLLEGKYFTQTGNTADNDWYDDLQERKEFTQVVGLDIGHGWTRAWLYKKGEDGWTAKALKLDAEGHTCIPTRISYDQQDDDVLLGYETDPQDCLYLFKTPPKDWNKLSPDGSHTFKTLMNDFISILCFTLPDYNPEFWKDWGFLLVVGCPFSTTWTGTDDYRDLVKEASARDYVVALPESSAALMYAAHQDQLELSGGVALFDIGAVTTDFLYVQQGKKLIARSLEWGGNQMDRSLLDEMLKDNGLSRRAVPPSHLACVLDQVRQIKEEFDPAQAPLERKLTLRGAGVDGQDREIPVTVDQNLMDKALIPLLPELERFFQDMKKRIGSRPCGTVLLAGGASQPPQILELAAKVFGAECQVRLLDDPANCVAQGLALTMCGRLQCINLVAQQRDVIEDYLAARFDGFRLHCSDVVLSSFFSVAPRQLQRVQQSGKTLRLGQIIALVEKGTKAAGLPEEQKLGWHLEDVSHEVIQALAQGVPYLIEYIYKSPNQPDAQALMADTEQKLNEKRDKVNLNDLMAQILGQTNFKKLFFFSCIDEDILKRHNSSLYRVARSASTFMFPLHPPLTDEDTWSLEDWRSVGAFKDYPELMSEQMFGYPIGDVQKNLHRAQDYINLEKKDPVVNQKTMSEILEHIQSEHWLHGGWERNHMELVLDKCPMLRQIYDQLFRDLYEIVLGKVLLLVFDERADIL